MAQIHDSFTLAAEDVEAPPPVGARRGANASGKIVNDLVGMRDAEKKKKVDASTDNLNPENAFDGKITPKANFMLTNWLMKYVWTGAFLNSLAMFRVIMVQA